MKAKLFHHNDRMEIRLSNTEQFIAGEDENQAGFYRRIEAYVELEYDEDIIDPVSEIDIKKMKKETSAALERRLPLLQDGVETEMIREILESRGIELPNFEPESKPEPKCKPKKNLNVGKACTFTPFRQDVSMSGTIKAFVADKRVDRSYYKILAQDKKIYHKRINNDQLSIS